MTESMDQDEKKYWLDLLPSMTKEQIKSLYDILLNEKQKLEELEKKYVEEIKELNEKHLLEWKAFMKSKEGKKDDQVVQPDIQSTDEILKMLDDIS